MKEEWEMIDTGGERPSCRRMMVPGGWIFDTWALDEDGKVTSISTFFIPDKEHIWGKEKIELDKDNLDTKQGL